MPAAALTEADREAATLAWAAYNQLQTYKLQIPSLLAYTALLAISDGLSARLGSLTADRERFMPWRTIAGEELAPASLLQLEVLTRGVFEHRRFLELLRAFIVFEDDGGGPLVKKIAGYHQFHAVQRTLAATLDAAGPTGRRRRRSLHHHPEVHARGQGRALPAALRPAQHRGDRRRSPP